MRRSSDPGRSWSWSWSAGRVPEPSRRNAGRRRSGVTPASTSTRPCFSTQCLLRGSWLVARGSSPGWEALKLEALELHGEIIKKTCAGGNRRCRMRGARGRLLGLMGKLKGLDVYALGAHMVGRSEERGKSCHETLDACAVGSASRTRTTRVTSLKTDVSHNDRGTSHARCHALSNEM